MKKVDLPHGFLPSTNTGMKAVNGFCARVLAELIERIGQYGNIAMKRDEVGLAKNFHK